MAQIKNKYLFPNFLAEAMAKVDMKTQLEASMLSMAFMLIGLIITVAYLVIYFNFALWYKILLVINGIAGFIFLSSFLITTFQSYQSHCEILEFQIEMKGGSEKNAKKN